jgi:hypothetical protein
MESPFIVHFQKKKKKKKKKKLKTKKLFFMFMATNFLFNIIDSPLALLSGVNDKKLRQLSIL